MMQNDRGSSLVQVLLVILVFTVLGLALMGNVVGENKRTNATESNMQARYLAESGLTYFENDFKRFIKESVNLESISVADFSNRLKTNFLQKYMGANGFIVGEPWSASHPEEINIKAQMDGDDLLKVTSRGKDDSSEETLIGYYKINYLADFDKATFPLTNFNGLAVDFTKKDVLGLDLLSLLNLDLIDSTGSDQTFYRVPDDHLIGVGLLFDLVGLHLLSSDRFKTMEENHVIATRQGELLGVDVLKGKKAALLSVNVLPFQDEYDTNVLIDGGYTAISLLIKIDNYRDINFKKLAVIGNATIRQDKKGLFLNADNDESRSFTFREGLYVNKSLVIGGYQGKSGGKPIYSNLKLRGNMLVMKDLYINYVNLEFGDSVADETIYVKNNATINNACINKGSTNNKKFRLITQGTITLENNSSCNEFKGLFYGEKGINIKTNNQPMTIKGALIGDVTVDHPDKLTYIPDPNYSGYIMLKDIKIIPKGRTFQ
jgi:hypothetical protein